jgi:hypothetical protein
MSRQGIPDYFVTMRKPGENPERVTAYQRIVSPFKNLAAITPRRSGWT